MTDHSDLIEQIQAAAEITGDELLQAAASALSSQSLSLSEAREEIERLKGALLVVRPVVAGLIDAQYNVETWGLKGRLAKLDSELRRERVCEVCGGDCSAANPPPSYCPERDDFSALENGPAGLADATSNPPYPTSPHCGKGAEVAVKPLVWNEYETEGEVDRWDAETALGSFYEISTEFDGYSVSNDHVHSDQRFDTPDEAKAFAQSDYETRIRSALVSGGA